MPWLHCGWQGGSGSSRGSAASCLTRGCRAGGLKLCQPQPAALSPCLRAFLLTCIDCRPACLPPPHPCVLCSQEKARLDELKALAKKKEELQIRLEQAENRLDLAVVADIKYGECRTAAYCSGCRPGQLGCRAKTAPALMPAWLPADQAAPSRCLTLPRPPGCGGGASKTLLKLLRLTALTLLVLPPPLMQAPWPRWRSC